MLEIVCFWGVHGSDCSDCVVLGCDGVQSRTRLQMFHRNILPQSSVSKVDDKG
jgi:hypothetical protein